MKEQKHKSNLDTLSVHVGKIYSIKTEVKFTQPYQNTIYTCRSRTKVL